MGTSDIDVNLHDVEATSRQPKAIEDAITRVRIVTDRLGKITAGIADDADRLVGQEPKEEARDSAGPATLRNGPRINSGSIGELNEALDAIGRAVAHLSAQAARFRGL